MKLKHSVPAFVFVFAVLVISALSLNAQACTRDGKEGFLPENDLNISVSAFATYATTEEEFNAAMKKAALIYAPVFKAQGRILNIHGDWKDGTVNAYAQQTAGNVSEVRMFGGLARHPKMTADGFMLVICHETGHHLGGAPKSRNIFGTRWASNEGQADYFSTLKCAREVWKDEDNAAVVSKLSVPAIVTERCQKGFNTSGDIALCQRSAVAGLSLGNTLAEMEKVPETHFETPDTRVVAKMDHSHPDAQCRLDTYFAASVCPVSKDAPLSDTDPTVGVCAQEKGEVLGVRPLCWYKLYDPNAKTGSTWPSLN
jgi:hypothetical protein